MNLPKDPIILLSYINTQLRDNYASLSEFTISLGADEEDIKSRLEKAGYIYDEETNRFIRK
ncbi:MAG: DUF4250 domain-containing protein [Eubacterium sp.]|nr:DUF4250 domain-containing protein [Eubacterium sp.]